MVAALTVEQFTAPVLSSFGSIRDTLVHLLSADLIWTARLVGVSPTQHLRPEAFADVPALRARWQQGAAPVATDLILFDRTRPAGLSLHPLTAADAAAVLAFEQENRAFFARWVPDRGDQYFSLAYLERFLAEIEAERTRGESYMYLVRRGDGEVVGRVNLVDVAQGVADLGYRVGARHGGQGYATEAVRQALAEAAQHGILTVKAMTTVENLGSQAVLLRNGFQFTQRRPQALDVNGTLHDAVHFAWSRSAGS